ncbi:PRA1 family protein [Helicosporidium sp. ATCC 50920]|nr:PRA1 family protein [Helicosporidium sp. ATCC 50920]|eukprot:KDD73978.1 PRA1 family protein [Helicosporidium sp. ATCC 50920]
MELFEALHARYTCTCVVLAKPWGELIDRTSFGRPGSTVEAVSRFRKNLSYFRVNYCIAGVATTSLVMLLHPWSLIVLAGLGVLWFWAYILRPGPLSFNGRELSEREKFAALAGTSLVVIFLLTNVGTTLFYALGLSALLVGLHGALYVPDDLFLDDVPDTQGGGLLSFLTDGAQRPATVVTTV